MYVYIYIYIYIHMWIRIIIPIHYIYIYIYTQVHFLQTKGIPDVAHIHVNTLVAPLAHDTADL